MLSRRLALASGLGIGLLVPEAAWAAASASGDTEGIFVAQIVLLLLVGRVLGEGMQRIGQPAIMGQLIGGILLGPSFFGALWPQAQHAIFPSAPEQKAMIDAVSQLGILMLLLLTGMETDTKLVRKVGRASASISISGVLIPFACGFALGQFLPSEMLPNPEDRLIPSLFLGTALSISSVKIVALVVREMQFMRRNLGQIIVASAIIEDTIGWIVIAITFGIAGSGSLDVVSIAGSIAGVALFLIVSFTFGRRIVFGLIRWANDNFHSEFPVITMILVIMGAMAEITQLLGVHTVLGAFVAGVLVGESPILTRHVEDQLRGLITALFMPVFFGLAGLSADLTILRDPTLALFTAGLVAIASVGKFGGAFLGGTVGGLSFKESLAVGCAMNARGSTEVIVASIGLSMGALTQNLFTMIVTMAVLTTTAMPPMLRRALAALPMHPDEKKRVERETLDEHGFVSNLERLLLAVDDSAAGKFTARIAGLLAGAQGMPITIVRLADETDAVEPPDGPSRQVKEGARVASAAAVATAGATDALPDKVHLTTRAVAQNDATAIMHEARKGFDLMLVGIENTHNAEGEFHPSLTRISRDFKGPLAILASRGAGGLPRLNSALRILVPVNGSPAARRGAEIAFAIARPTGARVTALYVSAGNDRKTRRRQTRSGDEGTLKDIAELGERYDVHLRTALQPKGTAESAILREAEGYYSLLVMGVTQRPGEQLFFGNTAATVLRDWRGPVLFVATDFQRA